MTDQHNKQNINLYREETAQIHAPVDLIERTKQVVAEEEKRLRQENGQNKDSRANGADADRTRRSKDQMEPGWKQYYKAVPRWVLPLTAAAVLVLTLRVSGVPFSTLFADRAGGADDTAGAAGMSGSADGATEETGMSGSVYGAAKAEGMSGSADGAAEAEGMSDGADGAAETEGMSGGAEEAAETEDVSGAADMSNGADKALSAAISGEGRGEAKAAGAAEEYGAENDGDRIMADSPAEEERIAESSADMDISQSAEKEAAEQERKREEDSEPEITITEVTKAPDFYRASDTERAESHGIVFYITEDRSTDTQNTGKSGWKAYVQYDKKKYLVTGSAADQEEFLESAYALLISVSDSCRSHIR